MGDNKGLFFVQKVCYNWVECILGVTFRYKAASIALNLVIWKRADREQHELYKADSLIMSSNKVSVSQGNGSYIL